MRRQTMPIVAGVILGVFGAALVMSYVRTVENKAGVAGESIPVYTATRTIPAGTDATSLGDAVKKSTMPRKFAPPGAVGDLSHIRGFFALQQITAGQTIVASDFGTAASSRGRLAIPKGKEAVSVSVPLDAGLARYAQPGDHVSVYVTFKATPSIPVQTQEILAGAEVLATEVKPATATAGVTPGSAADLTMTLAVVPADAGKLIFATEVGSLWMTLVPQGQASPVTSPVTFIPAKG